MRKHLVALVTYVTSDPRQEYRPWTGVRPAKSARRDPPAQYSSPGTQATQAPCETSYQAAYSGEAQRPTAPPGGENAIRTASDSIQPIPAKALQASLSSSGPQLRAGGSTKGEVSMLMAVCSPQSDHSKARDAAERGPAEEAVTAAALYSALWSGES